MIAFNLLVMKQSFVHKRPTLTAFKPATRSSVLTPTASNGRAVKDRVANIKKKQTPIPNNENNIVSSVFIPAE